MKKCGSPTTVQAQAWQAITKGGHVLMTAPTGSGKTLAAFLWGLDGLITGRWTGGSTRLLYVSPLKALNNDVRRNLLTPLKALRGLFEHRGLSFPQITVATRSGDTTQSERRRMLRQPPEILITTPESLNLLISSAGGRAGLTGVRTMILDEVHAILGSRRGTYLMTAVERLTRLSGEFQRIALSATVRPLEVAARFVGGYRPDGTSSGPRYTPRPVTVIAPRAAKTYALQVRQPEAPMNMKRTLRPFGFPMPGRSNPMDIVTAAVLVAAVEGGELETVQPISAPLDVLAQVLVSMCAFETWTPDALYAFIRTAQPYHTLGRRQFDLVLDLLEGRYQQTRLRELQPRIIHDRVDRTLAVKKGALLTLYTSGGVIPDRVYHSGPRGSGRQSGGLAYAVGRAGQPASGRGPGGRLGRGFWPSTPGLCFR